jgi:DNA-binding CsgD family transcriptional regulator
MITEMTGAQDAGGACDDRIGSAAWYGRLAEVFFAAAAEPPLRRMIDALVSLFAADNYVLLHFSSAARPDILLRSIVRSSRKNDVEDYRNAYYPLDPFYINLGRVHELGSAALSDVIDGPFHESEYYKFYYLDAGLLDELCFCAIDGDGGHILLSLGRSLERPFFAETDLAAMRGISPLVCAMLREQWRLLVAPDHGRIRAPTGIATRQEIESARLNFGRSLLTPRELDVLNLMLKGYSFENIARRLAISSGTVHVHRKHIYEKLDVNSLTELFSLFIDAICSVPITLGEDPLARYCSESAARHCLSEPLRL